jgi:tetratricopeptide (TPR) repeat protein
LKPAKAAPTKAAVKKEPAAKKVAVGGAVEAESQPYPIRKHVRSSKRYMDDVKTLFAKKNYKSAIAMLDEALHYHPNDAFLLSYRGCLDAVVDKNYRAGIKTCKKALNAVRDNLPFGQEFYLPPLYLNLGRAHLAAGEKDAAVKAFSEGLKLDESNKDIKWEMRKLGDRKPPPVSFLSRSNPINKYIGMMLHKMKK